MIGGRSILNDLDADRDEAYLAVRLAAVTFGFVLLVLLSMLLFGVKLLVRYDFGPL